MKQCDLPVNTIRLWQIRIGAMAVLILAALSFLYFASPWFLCLTISIFAVFSFVLFWYIPKYFKSYSIRFDHDSILIDRGVFIKTSHIMPYSRLIFAESLTTPLAKKMSLSAVSLKAARSILIIPEMKQKDVEKIVQAISKGDMM